MDPAGAARTRSGAEGQPLPTGGAEASRC